MSNDSNLADRAGAFPSPPPSDLDEAALTQWLQARLAGVVGRVTVEKFSGGQSNPTYRVSAGSDAYVLRRKPFGPLLPSAHAVEREFQLLEALHPAGLPTPRPLALCEDDAVIGSAFYIMEMVEGRTFWDGALPDLSPDSRRAVYEGMIDALAQLHTIDPIAVGLETFGRPGNYFGRQVERWTRQYRASQTEVLAGMEALIEWLPISLPEQTRMSVIHGDYRIDNLLFMADRPEVAAILDWELATLGDPLSDFAYLMLNWVLPHAPGKATLGGLDLKALGIPTLQEATQRYCQATGRDGAPNLDWYFAYSLFRGVGIIQGIQKRILDGNASSPHAAVLVAQIPAMVEIAWTFAMRAGAPQSLLS